MKGLVVFLVLFSSLNASLGLSSPSFSLSAANFPSDTQTIVDYSSDSLISANAALNWAATAVDGTVALSAAAPWLTFTPPATLSGTPSANSVPVVVWFSATDSSGNTLSRSVLVTVDNKSPPLPQCGTAGGPPLGVDLSSCTGKSTAAAVLQKAYRLVLPGGLFTGSSLTYSASISPSNVTWITFDTERLVLFGTPDQLTSPTVVVTAVDPTGAQALVHVPIEVKEKSDTNVGAIVGGVVGGIIAALILAGLIFWFVRRRRRQSRSSLDKNWDKNMARSHIAGNSESTLMEGRMESGVASPNMAYLSPSPPLRSPRHQHQNSIRSVNNYVIEQDGSTQARKDYLVAAAPLGSINSAAESSHNAPNNNLTDEQNGQPLTAFNSTENQQILAPKNPVWYKSIRRSLGRLIPVIAVSKAFNNRDSSEKSEHLVPSEKELPEIRKSESNVPPNMLPKIPTYDSEIPDTPIAIVPVSLTEYDKASLYTNGTDESVSNILSNYSAADEPTSVVKIAALHNGLVTPSTTPLPQVQSDEPVGANAHELAPTKTADAEIGRTIAMVPTVPNESITVLRPAEVRRPSAFSNTVHSYEIGSSTSTQRDALSTEMVQFPTVVVQKRVASSPSRKVESILLHAPENSPHASESASVKSCATEESTSYLHPASTHISTPKASTAELDENGVISLRCDEGWIHDFRKVLSFSKSSKRQSLALHSSLRRSLSRHSNRRSQSKEIDSLSTKTRHSFAKHLPELSASVGLRHLDPETGYTVIYEPPSWLSLTDGTIRVDQYQLDEAGNKLGKIPGDYFFVIFQDDSTVAGEAKTEDDDSSKVHILQEFIVSVKP